MSTDLPTLLVSQIAAIIVAAIPGTFAWITAHRGLKVGQSSHLMINSQREAMTKELEIVRMQRETIAQELVDVRRDVQGMREENKEHRDTIKALRAEILASKP